MAKKDFIWQEPTKLWNKMFISVFIASLFFSFSAMMSNSLLSLYAKSTGAPADQIGSLMSLFALTALFCRFIAGPMMNAYNRKKLLQMAMCFFSIAYFGFSFSPSIAQLTGMNVIVVMKIFRLIQGLGNAFGNACLLTIVSDCIPKEKFSSGMGFYACANTIAQAIGPTAGVALRDAFGYNITYIITACSMLFSMILVGFIVKTPNRATGKLELKLKNMVSVEAAIPSILTFLISLGFTSISSFFLVYAEERGISGASYYFTVYAVAMLATRPLVGKISDKYGLAKVLVPSMLFTAISLVFIGYASSLWQLLIIGVINAAGYGAAQPALQSLCMKSVPASKRGSASSTNFIAMDSATLIGPTVCGKVATMFGYTPIMWISMAVPVVLGALLSFLFREKITQIEEQFKALQG